MLPPSIKIKPHIPFHLMNVQKPQMAEISTNFADEKWVNFNSVEDPEEEEEALSLCDLPTNEEDEKDQSKKQAAQSLQTPQEDFDFGSWGGGSVFTESQMCNADEIFFQGQILPVRHFENSDSALTGLRTDIRNLSRSVSKSESMDHFSTGGFTSISSRSSRSSSVSSTSTTNTIIPPKGYNHKPVTRNRNQFHSHPSPTPQIRTPSFRRGNSAHSNQKSSMWSFLQVGLLRTPEIGLADLKVRSKNNTMKRFGSHNSNSSSCNSSNNVSNVEDKKKDVSEKKKKQRLFFETNGRIFGGCKCSVNAAVESTVPSRIVLVKSSSTTAISINEEGNLKEEREELLKKKTKQQNPGKQAMSRHRTFEWLKQLSLQQGEV